MRWLTGLLLAITAGIGTARADIIQVVIPFAPGGSLDPMARIMVNGWSKLRPHDTIVVENIGGAGGVLAMGRVAKAAPDGRTLLFSPAGNIVMSPSLQPNLPYDAARDFEPVIQVGAVKTALIVRSSLGVNSLAELITLAKSGKPLTFGSTGPGTSAHIAGAMLNYFTGMTITHVPYRGLGPALNDMMGGHLDMIVTSVIGVLPYVQQKSAIALATFDTERSDRLPDVPTSAELGYPDLIVPQWYGVLAPRGLPVTLRQTMETELLSVLRSPEVSAQLETSGVSGATGTKDFQALLDAEFKKWPVIIDKLGIKLQ
jgi:tripartite-type tricarboxylate transporter receptor subunit TctC